MCFQNGCKKQGYYNFLGADGKFCREHKLRGMSFYINYCEYPDCKTIPIYNLTGETKARFCSEHKLEGMVDIMNKRCEHHDCSKIPNYNLPGETKARFCSEHKTEGMVNVISKRCEHHDCKTRPIYSSPGETNARFCAEHKLEGMVNKKKKCETPRCLHKAIYNTIGEIEGKFCKKHKLEGMENIFIKICKHPDCFNRAHYNKKGENIGMYCWNHKIEEMIFIWESLIDEKKCEYNNCEKRACYSTYENYCSVGETIGIFCSTHKRNDMVYIFSSLCEHIGCTKQTAYNLPGENKGRFCNDHKLKGMINVKYNKCKYYECDNRPTYNSPGETKAKFCREHKLEGMIDIFVKRCKTPLCDIQVKDKYRGYCLRCFMYMFPNEPVTRNYKTKETATVDRIREEFEERVDLTTDKIVAGGCSKRRPDCYIDLGYQVIIIEVDENQHTDYDCSCENKRTMELSRDFNFRPIVFIRFNPDKYIRDGEVITSCWGTNKKGITTVKKSKVKEWNTRLNTLIDTIEYWIEPENKTSKTVEVIQLYYDSD